MSKYFQISILNFFSIIIFESGEGFAFITSIFRGGTDLYSPFTGTIIEVNSELDDKPEYVNDKPYDDGWMIKIKLEDPDEIEGLMSEQEYLLKRKEQIENFN